MTSKSPQKVKRVMAVALAFSSVFVSKVVLGQHADIENILAACDYPRIMGQVHIGFPNQSILEFRLSDYFKQQTVQIPVARATATDRYGFLEFVCTNPGCISITETPMQPGVTANNVRRSGFSFPYCDRDAVRSLVTLFKEIGEETGEE